jgi:outer membrane protein assembly factor BamB
MQTRVIILVAVLLSCGIGVRAQQNGRPARPSKADRNDPLQQSAEVIALSSSPLALPFKKTWQHLTDAAMPLEPTLDGAQIYVPLVGGRVFCLNRDTGALLWSAEPGGIVTSPIAVNKSVVYIATKKIAADGTEAGASLLAADRTTGLTLWVKD